MSRPLRPLAVLLIALVVPLAVVGTGAARTPRLIGIGQKQNGEDAKVSPGDTLVVVLPANSASSFNWRIVTYNRTILRADANGYVPALHPPLAQKAAGVAIFVFKVLKRGTTPLKLIYIKTGAKTPANTFSTTIKSVPED